MITIVEQLDLLEVSQQRALSVVDEVSPADLARPTPCDEWNVHMLLNKMLASAQLFSGLAAGRQPDDSVSLTSPAALLPEDPSAISAAIDVANRECFSAFKVGNARGRMVGPLGATLSRRAGVMIRVTDCTVNIWDLARSIGADHRIDDDHAMAVLEFADDYLAEARDHDGELLFAEPLETDEGLPPLDRLIALSGRDPSWVPGRQ